MIYKYSTTVPVTNNADVLEYRFDFVDPDHRSRVDHNIKAWTQGL